MITAIVFAALLVGGAVYTALNPILLPSPMISSIVDLGSGLWSLEGILPISAIVECIYFDVYVIVLLVLFKVIMGAISGKPEID